MPHKKPSSHALRIGRVSLQNQIYHVTFVTEGREQHFMNLQCARLMVKSLQSAGDAGTLAFVVMPDHVHWLVQLMGQTSLSRVLQSTKSGSARQINRYLGRKGRFWQNGFHDHALRKEESVRKVARYIIANPLRAGLVRSVKDYPHWDAVWV